MKRVWSADGYTYQAVWSCLIRLSLCTHGESMRSFSVASDLGKCVNRM